MDGYKLPNSNWKTQYLFFKGGVSWPLGTVYDLDDPPPTVDELTSVDLKMIKLIK